MITTIIIINVVNVWFAYYRFRWKTTLVESLNNPVHIDYLIHEENEQGSLSITLLSLFAILTFHLSQESKVDYNSLIVVTIAYLIATSLHYQTIIKLCRQREGSI